MGRVWLVATLVIVRGEGERGKGLRGGFGWVGLVAGVALSLLVSLCCVAVGAEGGVKEKGGRVWGL